MISYAGVHYLNYKEQPKLHFRDRKSGFTIVELSVVLIIIGIIITFSISFIELLTKQNKLEDARNQIERIDEAIVNYVRANGHLPCPADLDAVKPSAEFGSENDCSAGDDSPSTEDLGTSGSEELILGTVPTRSLGLKDLDLVDPWGNKIAYIAVSELAQNRSLFRDYTSSATDGVIEVTDSAGNQLIQIPDECPSDPAECPIVSYLLFSHGERGYGSFSILASTKSIACDSTYPLDAENCDISDNIFISAPINDGEILANYFDDVVSFKLKSQLEWELKQ